MGSLYPTFVWRWRPKLAGPKATPVAGLRDRRLRPARPSRVAKAITHSLLTWRFTANLYPILFSHSLFARRGKSWRHCANYVLVARGDFISILLSAKRAKSLFKRAGDVFFVQGRVFSRAVCSRAGGNLVKTCQHILTISLFRRGARLSYRRVLPLRRAGAPFG